MSRIKASSNSLIICCFLLLITVLLSNIPHGVSSGRPSTNFPQGFGRRLTPEGQSCVKGSQPGHPGSSTNCGYPPSSAVVQMTAPSPNSAISYQKVNNTGNGSQKVTNNSLGGSVPIVNNKGNGKQTVTDNGNGSQNAHNKVGRRLNENGDDGHSKTRPKGSDTGHDGSATGGDNPPSGVEEQMLPPTSGSVTTVYVTAPSSPSSP